MSPQFIEERFTNIARHARATRVRVSLEHSPEQIQLCVEDNGEGFDPESARKSGHLGLVGIRERVNARVHALKHGRVD